MSRIARRQFLRRATALLSAGALASLHGGLGTAGAQGASTSDGSWPNRPVRFIVPLVRSCSLRVVRCRKSDQACGVRLARRGSRRAFA